jgi:hypothetical protein
MNRRKTTRREFARDLALLAAATPLAAASAQGAQPADPPRPAEGVAGMAQALTEVIRLRHAKHLTEDQLQRVRQQVERNLRSGAALRRPPLRNGDEPDFVFFAEVY